MQYETLTANDGCTIAFQTSHPLAPAPPTPTSANPPGPPSAIPSTCILLLHGFSGSSAYFTRNFAALRQTHWVVAPDMRGHGLSSRTRGGYHVARLAADLRELLAHLRSSANSKTTPSPTPCRFVPVGCSIGAAVLWTYVELFGEDPDLAGFVFVDQAPLQDRSLFGAWDETRAHYGCFDEKRLLAAQEAWVSRPAETHRALVAECLGYRFRPGAGDRVGEEEAGRDEEFFTRISAACDGVWLARLLADHTRYDHREAVEGITRPTLVMAGRRSGCFPLAGMAETVGRVRKGGSVMDRKAELSVFESGHWLFYEESERFNKELLEFMDRV
ncbi:alpha/beta-hydrolase [Trichocladium antarcticum]|uniref:Alpha/beta-hydrolase n=1 Tax=Trichocladium antarcticum TaxID=1450529 RepID=A0AAN6ULI2_9PEZI|nr:alpha/beta-hydrolase [Trichocladium antarcticum]